MACTLGTAPTNSSMRLCQAAYLPSAASSKAITSFFTTRATPEGYGRMMA